MTTDPPPPRRKWHFNRWLIVLIIAMFGWSGWQAYAFRSALKQAKALGWEVQYRAPLERIWQSWRAAFRKRTWLDGVTFLRIPTSEEFEQRLAIVHRLNPKRLGIDNAASLRDLSALKPLPRLREVRLSGCTGLTNVDALTNLSALQSVWLTDSTGLTDVDALKNLSSLQDVTLGGCTGLTNVDALKNLSGLQWVQLNGCTGLTPESVASLKAALPDTRIIGR